MCAIFKFSEAKLSKSDARPASAPVPQAPELHQAQLAAASHGQRTGGDCYDFLRISSTRVLFAMLDVAGRLSENQGIVSAIQTTFRTRASQLFAAEDANEADAMIDLCLDLNRTVLATARRVCSSPVFAGCYNEDLGTVCYFNAGHTPGLLRDEHGITELPATSLPLGLFSHYTPDATFAALKPGASLVVVSRGVVESRYKNKEFGLSHVKDHLQFAKNEDAQELCAGVLGKVREFVHKGPRQNDLTVLALTRAENAGFAGFE
jgi:serine phosphatase RsbU (regulator of sigma subunit)